MISNYKVKINDSCNYKVNITDIQNKYKFKIFCAGADLTDYYTKEQVDNSQAVQDTLINNLLNQIPTGTATGETISITDSSDLPIKDIQMLGNTSQTTTTGKNKYGITSVVAKNYSSGLPTGDTQNLVIDSYDLNNIKFHSVASGNYIIALLPTYELEPSTSYTLTYTRTNTLSTGASARRYIYSLDSEDNYSLINSLVEGDEGSKSYTFTTTATGKVAIAFGYLNNSSTNSSEINDLMLRLSSDTSATFEPYTYGASPNPDFLQNIKVVTGENTIVISNSNNSQSQSFLINLGNIELCKVSTYKDRIYFSNNKWYLEKNINKITFNGSENWYIYSGILYLESVTDYLKTGNVNVPYSNYYRGGQMRSGIGTITDANKNTIALSNNSSPTFFRVFVNDGRGLTTEQFKTWLSTHNTILYYILNTPITTEITDTTLISQLNTIKNASTYKTVTEITITTTNEKPTLTVTYRKDLETIIGG